MIPFALQWYVQVKHFDLFGKLRVIMIIRPGNLEVGTAVIDFKFPVCVQAHVRSALRIIIMTALIHPCHWGFSFIP